MFDTHEVATVHERCGGECRKGGCGRGGKKEKERKKEAVWMRMGMRLCGKEVRTDRYSQRPEDGEGRCPVDRDRVEARGGEDSCSFLYYLCELVVQRSFADSPAAMSPAPPPPQPSTYASKHPESTPRLLSALRDLHATDPKAIRTTVHRYPAALYAHGQNEHARDRLITSWKMTEHMYFKKSLVFPTLARGLFTEEVLEGDPVPPLEACSGQIGSDPDAPRERIVLRGYDKFFNTGEVSWTEVGLAALYAMRFADTQTVGRDETTHPGTVLPYAQIQWLPDPHICAFSHPSHCGLQAFPRHHHSC